jgi:hypothetical protein
MFIRFRLLVQAYISAGKPSYLMEKNWDFPKIHSQQHIFDDIVAKGATRNYNSKPNEGLNRPLKAKYTHTNFRDVAEQVNQANMESYYWLTISQILNLDHQEYLVSFMRTKLNNVDRKATEQLAEKLNMGGQADVPPTAPTIPVHFHLGSPEKKEKPLLDLTAATKFSVPGLLRMLEAFSNGFRTSEEGYHKVRNTHMVSVLAPLAVEN